MTFLHPKLRGTFSRDLIKGHRRKGKEKEAKKSSPLRDLNPRLPLPTPVTGYFSVSLNFAALGTAVPFNLPFLTVKWLLWDQFK